MSSFYGGARFLTLGAATETLSFGSARVQRIEVTNAAAVLKLPSALNMPQLGGIIFYIFNETTSSFSLPIKDFASTTLLSLSVTKWAEVSLIRNDTAAGKWFIREGGVVNTARTIYQAARPTPVTLPASCPPAMAKYMLVDCNEPEKVVYSSDEDLETAVGKVVKMGTKCYFVYRIRLSGVYPEGPAPAFTIYNSCKECNKAAGNGGTGDADDGGIEPDIVTRINYDGTPSTKSKIIMP